jgi:hypothetical protein
MISVIADVLKSKLSNLVWIERFGGLVSNAVRPEFIQGADGAQIVKGYQSYPVACNVNAANCWENGKFKHFEPDSSKSAIAFFMDNGGAYVKEVQAPKNASLKFSFDLKFVCWLNTARLGDGITGGGCNPSGRVAPYVVAQFFGEHSAVGLFEGGVEEDMFTNIEVSGIRQLIKNPSMFAPFSFVADGEKRGLFLYPYDYFGLNITGSFIVNKNCLPEFGEDWEADENCNEA